MTWPTETQPATQPQLKLILVLLRQAGFGHPNEDPNVRRHFGLTQKQARGKWDIKAASDFIDQLRADLDQGRLPISDEPVTGPLVRY